MAALPLKLSGKVLISDSAGNVLLLRRSASSRHNAGKWEFPGGKNDPGEELQDTLLREVFEETALRIELGRVLGAAENSLPDCRVAYLFLEGVMVNGSVSLSDEHDECAWVPRGQLATYDVASQFREIAQSYAVPPSRPAGGGMNA